VHCQAEKLHHWQYSDSPDHRLRLLDYSLALPLTELHANSFVGPATHPLASLLPAKWDVHIDYLGVALLLHELLFPGKQLRTASAKDGSVTAELCELPKRKLEADWAQVFSALLSVRASPLPALSAVRAPLDKFLSTRAQKVSSGLRRMKVAALELLAAKRPSMAM
jgi:hypothetical protein